MPDKFRDLFPKPKPVIGMIHLLPLPGTPAYNGNPKAIVDTALRDAATYQQAGVDGLILENMHDLPYLKGDVGHEISTTMAVIGYIVRNAFGLPCGIQVLAGANKAALAAAKAAGLDFIRAEGFVFGHVADEGWMDADAGPLLRYRKQIDAEDVFILTDIKKKHSAHAATADVDLVETARAAAFFRSDGLIVTGTATGDAADPDALQGLRGATQLPVLVGSGVDERNIGRYFGLCDGFIIGSAFKAGGHWGNSVDLQRVMKIMAIVDRLRETLASPDG